MITPRALGIGLESWRPYQYETLEWLKDTHYTAAGTPLPKISEQFTGTGKSAIAMALNGPPTVGNQVLVLTHTRSLQHQYGRDFPDCHIQYGRAHYPCTYPRQPLPAPTAEDCLFAVERQACSEYPCAYYAARQASLIAPRVALNYAYWLTLHMLYHPSWLVMDEAHLLADVVLDHTGLQLTEADCQRWNLAALPVIQAPEVALMAGTTRPHDAVQAWLAAALRTLERHKAALSQQIARHPTRRALQQLQALAAFQRRLDANYNAVTTQPGPHWYIRADGQRLTVRALTARYDFARFFTPTAQRSVLMSATLGRMDVFAAELGLREGEWEGHVTPNIWPASARPVHILDAPPMGHRSIQDAATLDKQADVIAAAILAQPPEWCGFVLVSRKAETLLLAARLAARGLEQRVFPIADANLGYMPTDEQLALWEARKRRVPGSIGVSHSFWMGIDGRQEKILIAAKVPFAPLNEPYERARMLYNRDTFMWRAARTLEQGLGRTRRGNAEDYDTADERRGFVAIADADWTRVRDYLSANITEALVTG